MKRKRKRKKAYELAVLERVFLLLFWSARFTCVFLDLVLYFKSCAVVVSVVVFYFWPFKYYSVDPDANLRSFEQTRYRDGILRAGPGNET